MKGFTAYIFICMLLLHRYSDSLRVGSDKESSKPVEARRCVRACQLAFADPHRVIAEDLQHSESEKWYYCFGKAGDGVMTVWLIYRENVIRIRCAGDWRRGKAIYERENKIYK